MLNSSLTLSAIQALQSPGLADADGWLNANGPAIQAVAAVLSLIVAAILAWLTARYVALTSSIARASADQARESLEMHQSVRRSQALQLAALARRLRTPLTHITLDGPVSEQLERHLYRYSDRDVGDLQSEAAFIDARAVAMANVAADALNIVDAALTRSRGFKYGEEWLPSEKERIELVLAINKSIETLDELERYCRRLGD